MKVETWCAWILLQWSTHVIRTKCTQFRGNFEQNVYNSVETSNKMYTILRGNFEQNVYNSVETSNKNVYNYVETIQPYTI